jgi:DNA-binding transcriptional regulator YhcF (GntR family)
MAEVFRLPEDNSNRPVNIGNILNELEEKGLIEYTNDNNDMLSRKINSKHLSEIEVCTVILPYIVKDVRISSRELARLTGLHRNTIQKIRESEMFSKLLLEYTNKKMLGIRSTALEELEKILVDPEVSPNVKIKAIHEGLTHSERILEIYSQANKELPKIDVNLILKELENM